MSELENATGRCPAICLGCLKLRHLVAAPGRKCTCGLRKIVWLMLRDGESLQAGYERAVARIRAGG